MKITPPFRIFSTLAFGTLLAAQLAAAQSPREHLSLDAGWRFHPGDDWPDALSLVNAGTGSGPASEKFSDAYWREVNLPHHWAVELRLRAGDNVIAVGVNNTAGQGGLNPNVSVHLIGNSGAPPWSRSLFNGLAQIIVQSRRDAGEIKLTASADGLTPATAAVRTQSCQPRPSVP